MLRAPHSVYVVHIGAQGFECIEQSSLPAELHPQLPASVYQPNYIPSLLPQSLPRSDTQMHI